MTQEHAVVTPEMIAQARARYGQEFRPGEPFFNTQATRDNIRKFAQGIGDINPLYNDEEYGKGTRYGCMVAPPTFLLSVYWPIVHSLPGIHAWHAGNDFDVLRDIRLNDDTSYTITPLDLVEKGQSQMANRIWIQYILVKYFNQNNELIANRRAWTVRAERASTRDTAKYASIRKAAYTGKELEAIERDLESEEIRGALPRYWEDVNEGDIMRHVVKGPLTVRDMIAWLMGCGSPFIRAHRIASDYRKRHPSTTLADAASGQADVVELVHMQEGVASQIGLPGAYDYGAQRSCWVAQTATNWMGDDGFLKKFYVEIRRFNFIGDTTWCRGNIIRKYIEGEQHLVDCELWAENQRHEATAPGRATIVLPSRGCLDAIMKTYQS
ncbi:MAG: MaoC family dehydratase N-terminal domain-containing protein [Chloroflexi bacterium]|nr:MaoC family dehydratase N-terminal domain-containing protein [Chloroflexota bacterium]